MTTYLVIGLVNGALYALYALGIVLMYQTTRILNFAFGAIGMVAAFSFATLALGLNVWIALAVVVVGAAAAGAAFGVVTLPIQDAPEDTKAVASLALVTALGGAVVVGWGSEPRRTPVLSAETALSIAGVAISWQRVLTIGITAGLCVGMLAMFRVGRLGAALRAMAGDTDVSRLIGLPVRRLWVVSWVLATVTASVGAVLVLPEVGLQVAPLTFVVLPPLAAAMAARFRHATVAVAAALALGIADGLFQYHRSISDLRGTLPLVLVVGALLLARDRQAFERV